MRLATLALGLLLAAAHALPAAAETYKTPQALLKALYAFSLHSEDGDPDAPSLYSGFFSDHLNGLIKADRDKTPEGEIGALDFDPVIAGQDGQPSDLKIGQPLILDNSAEVEVEFINFEPVKLHYTLVKQGGGWKVGDIAKQDGEYQWSLGAIFAGGQ